MARLNSGPSHAGDDQFMYMYSVLEAVSSICRVVAISRVDDYELTSGQSVSLSPHMFLERGIHRPHDIRAKKTIVRTDRLHIVGRVQPRSREPTRSPYERSGHAGDVPKGDMFLGWTVILEGQGAKMR